MLYFKFKVNKDTYVNMEVHWGHVCTKSILHDIFYITVHKGTSVVMHVLNLDCEQYYIIHCIHMSAYITMHMGTCQHEDTPEVMFVLNLYCMLYLI